MQTAVTPCWRIPLAFFSYSASGPGFNQLPFSLLILEGPQKLRHFPIPPKLMTTHFSCHRSLQLPCSLLYKMYYSLKISVTINHQRKVGHRNMINIKHVPPFHNFTKGLLIMVLISFQDEFSSSNFILLWNELLHIQVKNRGALFSKMTFFPNQRCDQACGCQ